MDHEGSCMRILFVEPPLESWFIMGKYMPPPFGLLTLAAYLERESPDAEIEVLDCQAEGVDWSTLGDRMRRSNPDVIAPSGLSTCNAYAALRVADIARRDCPDAKTVLGGQHFTALADETLNEISSVDYIVRGEGEITFSKLAGELSRGGDVSKIDGLSYRQGGAVRHNPDRPQIADLNSLPYPAYHYVKKHMSKYYFTLMAGEGIPFAIVEGSRGCHHNCSYCSQWQYWGKRRGKTPKRVADEMDYIHGKYGSKFFWLTDDSIGFDREMEELCDEIIERGVSDEVCWFIQARCDEVVRNAQLIPKMRKAGAIWMLLGMDPPQETISREFNRAGGGRDVAKKAVDLLRENSIFSQGTFIIGSRSDTVESINQVVAYADEVDPDIATFMTLTPFPGTSLYAEAKEKGWIEVSNWSDYDMIHAIMPTENLSRKEVQKQLYEAYRIFFGSWKRRRQGIFSNNPITRRTYIYLMKEAMLAGLRSLF